MTPDRETLHRTLQSVFGWDQFRPHQEEVIRNVLEGRNTLAILPSGHGKSLCYQLPACLLPGATLVFSPLIALMKDQSDTLNARFKIPSVALNHELVTRQQEQYAKALRSIESGERRIVFMAPERLDSQKTIESLRRTKISLVVIDEAHCVSLWGHDFRPHYRKVIDFAHSLGNTPILALTATAPPRLEDDLLRQLGQDTISIRASSFRENLHVHVLRVNTLYQKLSALENIIRRLEGSGIVYVGTHEECERVTAFLNSVDISARYYHGGIESGRDKIQEGFMNDQWRVTVATNALGMGVDKSNIRFIIHFRFPSSPEAYYQEIGRAGRDGQKADCLLLFDEDDVDLQKHFLKNSYPTQNEYKSVIGALSRKEARSIREVVLELDLSMTKVENILFHLVDKDRATPIQDWTRTKYILKGFWPLTSVKEFEKIKKQRQEALDKIREYSATEECLMEFLCAYLGDAETRPCGHCSHCKKYRYETYLKPTEGVRKFEEDWHPILKECKGVHAGGICLDFYRATEVGNAVGIDKYKFRRGYRNSLVLFAVESIRKNYPVAELDGICSVPTLKDPDIVRIFADNVADHLGLPFFAALRKMRETNAQKAMRSKDQKQDNVEGAFSLTNPDCVQGKTILLVDDIFDSGWTLLECAQTLKRGNAKSIHVFTLVRTQHVDDV